MLKRLSLTTLALFLALAISPVTAAAARGLGRCYQTCSYLRSACDVRCDGDCSSMYPNDPFMLDACLSTCGSYCADSERESREICQRSSRTPPTPTEP